MVVAGVGSSMVADFGGVVGRTQARFPLGYMGTARMCRAGCVKPGWLFPMMGLLHQLAPPPPTPPTPSQRQQADADADGLSLVNCGLPSCGLDCFLDCTDTKAPPPPAVTAQRLGPTSSWPP